MNLASRASLVAILTAGLTGVFLADAAFAQNPHAAPPVVSKGVAQPTLAPPAPPSQMMSDMQADQKKLDELVAAMNAATGCEKMGKMGAAITELAARQSRMTARMTRTMNGDEAKPEPNAAPPQTPKAQPNEHSQHHQE